MNITINAHNAAFSMRSFGAAPGHPPFVTLDVNGPQYSISIFLSDEAAADELIKAACLAKDALHGQDHAAAMGPLPDRGHYDAPSAAAVAEDLPHLADLAGTGLVSPAAARLQAEIDAAVKRGFPCKCGQTYTTARAFGDHLNNATALSPANRPFHGWADVDVTDAAATVAGWHADVDAEVQP